MTKTRKNEKQAIWLHCRLHLNPLNPEYEAFFKRNFDSSISCYETHSNRVHVHILAKIRKMRSEDLSEAMVKMFGVSGNTDYSITNVAPTEEDLKKISQYVCKGENKHTLPVVVFNTPDWTDDIIAMHHRNYYNVESVKIDLNNTELAVEVVPDKPKVKRKTWTEKIIDELYVEYETVDWDWHEPKHRQWMIDYVLKKLGDTKKIFNEHKVKEFVYACFNSLDAKNFRHDMSNKVYQIL